MVPAAASTVVVRSPVHGSGVRPGRHSHPVELGAAAPGLGVVGAGTAAVVDGGDDELLEHAAAVSATATTVATAIAFPAPNRP